MTGLLFNLAIILCIGFLLVSQGQATQTAGDEQNAQPGDYELRGEKQSVQRLQVGTPVVDQNGKPAKNVQEAMTIYRELRSAPQQKQQNQPKQ